MANINGEHVHTRCTVPHMRSRVVLVVVPAEAMHQGADREHRLFFICFQREEGLEIIVYTISLLFNYTLHPSNVC